jgi:hypothetical protein
MRLTSHYIGNVFFLCLLIKLVDGMGVEPIFTESESIVLPAKRTTLYKYIYNYNRKINLSQLNQDLFCDLIRSRT